VVIPSGDRWTAYNSECRITLSSRAGVQVIHILNKELLEHGQIAVEKLIPREVTMPKADGKKSWNPLASAFP